MDRIELVRAYFDHLPRGEEGLDRALALLSEDFVLDYTRSRGPAAGVYRGRERVRDFWMSILEALEPLAVLEDEIFEVGERVVRVGGFRARGRSSGVELAVRGATVWIFRDGVPAEATLYQSKDDAVRAVESDE